MNRTTSLILILLAAFLVGCAIMSLEMLASRYLNPYFGGTIFTWSALISVVLLAMMSGYFLGGFCADKLKLSWVLEAMICLAALYLIALPFFVDEILNIVITNVENVRLGALLGAVAVTLVPVTLLSTFTPIAIRRSLYSLDYAGRIAGTIFAIATAGNIVGTLLTSFYLIPNYGTRELTGWLAIVLVTAAIIVFLARRATPLPATSATIILAWCFMVLPLSHMPLQAESNYIDKTAAYPEGPVFIDGDLYYAEMRRNRVMKVEEGIPSNFFI